MHTGWKTAHGTSGHEPGATAHHKLNTGERCCGAQGRPTRSTVCKAQGGIFLLYVASVRRQVKRCALTVPFRRCGLAEGNAGNKKNGQSCSKQDTAKELKDGFEKGFSLGKTRPMRDVTKKKGELSTSAVNRTRNHSKQSAAKLQRR